MGPLEKMRAFGLNARDLPSAAWMGIKDSFAPQFAEHATDYSTVAERLFRERGSHDEQYNKGKGFWGGMDYMLRYDRSPEDAEKVARLYQLKQALFRDPKQDLLDLQANLDGIKYGSSNKKKLRPSQGLTDPENFEYLLNLAKDYAGK